MSNFEKITASPEALGTFLASLTVANGPWDKEFHEQFCAACLYLGCDTCPHEEFRNNTLWWLTKAAEGEQETDERTAKIVARRNGQVVLEPGTVIRIQKEEPIADGTCNEFNVYLNGKGPDGKLLRVEEVILPTVSKRKDGRMDPMDLTLTFQSREYAADVIKELGEKCKLEIRAAVQHWNGTGGYVFHGHSYILEATPLIIEAEPLKRQGGTGLSVGFQVDRYTATVGDTELWDFEWVGL